MKKLSLLLIIGAVAFAGCSDNSGDGPSGTPTTFTQKTILEYFSGAWCGFCPDGRVNENRVRAAVNENQFMAAVYHEGNTTTAPDQMNVIYDNAISQKFATGYPTGMINRINGVAGGSRAAWLDLTQSVLSETAQCGLAINAAKSGANLDVTVKLAIGATALPAGNYFMTVLLIEDEMSGTGPGWDQVNYYSKDRGTSGVNDPNHPYYNYPDPIVGYVHTNTVRGVLQNDPLGDAVSADALAAGAETEYTYSWDLSGLDSDLKVIAFLSEFTDKPQTQGIESSYVWNTQIVNVGENQDYD